MARITDLHKAIMSRDSCDFVTANELVTDMIVEVEHGRNPEIVLEEEGFEPDYFYDILPAKYFI